MQFRCIFGFYSIYLLFKMNFKGIFDTTVANHSKKHAYKIQQKKKKKISNKIKQEENNVQR